MINEKNLLLVIWTKPKATLEFILLNRIKTYTILLFVLGGIANSITKAQVNIAEHSTLSITILIFAVILGGLLGLLFYYVYAALLSWTGNWLDGKATINQFASVLAWSLIPSICTLILLVPKYIIFGDKTFTIDTNELNQLSLILYYLFIVIETLLSIWSIIILISGVSLIQGFTIWKALLNSILPIFAIIIPILLFLGIMYLLK